MNEGNQVNMNANPPVNNQGIMNQGNQVNINANPPVNNQVNINANPPVNNTTATSMTYSPLIPSNTPDLPLNTQPFDQASNIKTIQLN